MIKMLSNEKKLEVKEMLYQLASQLNDGEITIDETLDKLNGDNNLIELFDIDFMNEYIDVEAINEDEFEHITLNGNIITSFFSKKWYEIGEQFIDEIYLIDVNNNNLVRFINGLADQIHIF